MELLPSRVTASGARPLSMLTLRRASGGVCGRHKFAGRSAYEAPPVVSGIVSFVPPAPGTSAGGLKRTLASVMLIGWPGLSGSHVPVQIAWDCSALFGRTSVIVPSGCTLLAGSRVPIVVKERAAFCGTPVVP